MLRSHFLVYASRKRFALLRNSNFDPYVQFVNTQIRFSGIIEIKEIGLSEKMERTPRDSLGECLKVASNSSGTGCVIKYWQFISYPSFKEAKEGLKKHYSDLISLFTPNSRNCYDYISMVILGIDPGLAFTGYGVLEVDGNIAKFLTSGYIRTHMREQNSNRLARIYVELSRIIEDTEPQIAVIENAFSLGRYPKAGILLGMVIGAIHICLLNRGVRCFELTSREIKNAIVGHGGAKKEQVRIAIEKLLNIRSLRSRHASDALACALAFHLRGGPRKYDKIPEWKADFDKYR